MRAPTPAAAARLLLLVACWSLAALVPSAQAERFKVARAGGGKITVSWPLPKASVPATLDPGAMLRVAVNQPRRRAQPVTVSFGRLAPDGTLTPIHRRALRRGAFRFALPADPGLRYELALRSRRGKVLRRTVVQASGTTPPGQAPIAPPPSGVANPCPVDGTLEAEMGPITLAARAEGGTYVQTTLRNGGTGCFLMPVAGVDRLVGEEWSVIRTVSMAPVSMGPVEPRAILPGETVHLTAGLPIGTRPGTFRVRTYLQRAMAAVTDDLGDPTPEPIVTGTFDLTG